MAAGVTAAVLLAHFLLPHGDEARWAGLMRQAAVAMEESIRNVADERMLRLGRIDPITDPNGTGLIGAEWSPITSTLGQLGAKRTATNPNFAALLTLLLLEAGVNADSAVVISASGSFPSLLLATLHAVEVIRATPLLIVSLTASMFGANEPEFTLLDILACYSGRAVTPVAASVGGEDDQGSGLDRDVVESLASAIRARGIPLIEPDSLEDAVSQRMEAVSRAAQGREIDGFVNIGGGWSSMGTDSKVLEIQPGLNRAAEAIPPSDSRGLIFEFLDRGIPVVHLLNIRDLALTYDLPWDPVPLPEAGRGGLYYDRETARHRDLWLPAVWLVSMLAIFAASGPWFRTRRRRRPGSESGLR